MKLYSLLLILFAFPAGAYSQQYRPALFYCEEWKETKTEKALNQSHVQNTELILKLYGKGKNKIRKSHHDKPTDDPYYVWSGLCDDTWAVSLKHKTLCADLSKNAKIRWRTKQSGFRQLRIIIKLADGDWLISSESDKSSLDWKVTEFNIDDLKWRRFNIDDIVEQEWVNKPDLSCVEEIGFTDLMHGGTDACSRVDWIEVYAFPVEKK